MSLRLTGGLHSSESLVNPTDEQAAAGPEPQSHTEDSEPLSAAAQHQTGSSQIRFLPHTNEDLI